MGSTTYGYQYCGSQAVHRFDLMFALYDAVTGVAAVSSESQLGEPQREGEGEGAGLS